MTDAVVRTMLKLAADAQAFVAPPKAVAEVKNSGAPGMNVGRNNPLAPNALTAGGGTNTTTPPPKPLPEPKIEAPKNEPMVKVPMVKEAKGVNRLLLQQAAAGLDLPGLDKHQVGTVKDIKGNPVKVFEISGKFVRDNLDTDYTEGGHRYAGPRYTYIPEDEIWLDDANESELKAILLHELTEYSKMKYKHESYDKAHDEATAVERKLRKAEPENEALAKAAAAVLLKTARISGGKEYKVEVTTSNQESADTIAKLIATIGRAGNGGHSFSIIVDPGMAEYERSFAWDGDGADRLSDVKLDGKKIEGEKERRGDELKAYTIRYRLNKTASKEPWIGVDLDGTLAKYKGWKGHAHVGQPVPLMLNRVKRWLRDGKLVKASAANTETASNKGVQRVSSDTWPAISKTLPPFADVKDKAAPKPWTYVRTQAQPKLGLRYEDQVRLHGGKPTGYSATLKAEKTQPPVFVPLSNNDLWYFESAGHNARMDLDAARYKELEDKAKEIGMSDKELDNLRLQFEHYHDLSDAIKQDAPSERDAERYTPEAVRDAQWALGYNSTTNEIRDFIDSGRAKNIDIAGTPEAEAYADRKQRESQWLRAQGSNTAQDQLEMLLSAPASETMRAAYAQREAAKRDWEARGGVYKRNKELEQEAAKRWQEGQDALLKESTIRSAIVRGKAAKEPWIGVDLDGTLATYRGWKGHEHVGQPVPLMLGRVKRWLRDGKLVKILTARAGNPQAVKAINTWLKEHLGEKAKTIKVTDRKDPAMVRLYDDKAVKVRRNHGERMDKAAT